MLYDDSEQVEVRHVISLAHHTVDVYAGGETIPEGELWIKRNCIRLRYSGTSGELQAKPFYLFSENCSEKEDFYHALLQSKAAGTDADGPTPLLFEQADIIKLVQTLHASEEHLQYRWLNALIGRLFLALYKTQDVEDFIRMKFTKKIARVPKPALISHIRLQGVDMGDAAPHFTHLKLRELSINGDLTVEADVHYAGNFRIEIAATARIDLGPHFKAREVTMSLAGICKKLSGHVLLRLKPPPCNRLWISFETMPQIEMSIEPVVSARQIPYGIVLRAIESRIREVIAETLVFPNWDDMPFHNSEGQIYRGGVWADDSKPRKNEDAQTRAAKAGLVEQLRDKETEAEDEQDVSAEKSASMPSLLKNTAASGLLQRRGTSKTVVSLDDPVSGASSSSALSPAASPAALSPADSVQPRKPKAMRSHSFASAASPVLSMDPTTTKPQTPRRDGYDAATGLKDISSRTPVESPVGSLEDHKNSLMERAQGSGSYSSSSSRGSATASTADAQDDTAQAETDSLQNDEAVDRSATASLASSIGSTQAWRQRIPAPDARSIVSVDRRAQLDASIGTMTAAAKKFFANRRGNGLPTGISPGTPEPVASPTTPGSLASLFKTAQDSPPLGSPAHPIGRGQPLPPPGTPLPPPKSKGWHTSPLGIGSITGIGFAKRRPTDSNPQQVSQIATSSDLEEPGLPTQPAQDEPKANGQGVRPSQRSVTPPKLPARRRRSEPEHAEPPEETVFVVEAPEEDEVVGSMELGDDTTEPKKPSLITTPPVTTPPVEAEA